MSLIGMLGGATSTVLASGFFPLYDSSSQMYWMNIMLTSAKVATYMNYPENAFSFIGIVLNIGHFTILTRKNMRNSSVNVILAFLAIHDILSMTLTLFYNLRPVLGPPEIFCVPPEEFYNKMIEFLKNVFKSFFRRSSSWLVISMAAIRTLSVSLFDKPKFAFLSNTQFGLILIFCEFIFSSGVLFTAFVPFFFTGFYNSSRDYPYKQPSTCVNHNPNITSIEHVLEYSDEAKKRNGIIDAITINLVPCILYPIFTTVLVVKLHNMRKKRAKKGQEKKQDRNTKIVIAMTISFLIAEFPQTFAEYLTWFSTQRGFTRIGMQLKLIFVSLSLINGCTHCIICFGLSSNYRNAITDIFGFKKTTNVSLMKMSSVRTVSTALSSTTSSRA